MKMPFGPLIGSSAVRHMLVKHANTAGIDAPFLGSHVLRHSNASRHIDLGTRAQVVSSLLGHRDPQSLLRELAARTTVRHFEVCKPSLHDIFIRIAKPDAQELPVAKTTGGGS